MSKKISYKQDLPPPGGYKGITINRVFGWAPKSSVLIAAIAVFTPIAVWDYRTRLARNLKNMTEDDEGRQCLEPLQAAESDRLLLWQMRRNRDEENELMKDVPGWVTGTWFGEPLYKTNPNFDDWVEPTFPEVYAHTRRRDMNRQMFVRNWLA